MKTLIAIALALFTLNGFAQGERKHRKDHNERSQQMKDMTPEEVANIKSKQLTLSLTLDEIQESKVYDLILEEVKYTKANREQRKANKSEGKKPTKEQRLAMQNERLDKQIAFKRAMKSILTDEQFAKFEKLSSKRRAKKARQVKGNRN